MIEYIKGDVTNPRLTGHDIIVHIVNDMNKMGSGVAKALYKKWSIVKEQYHAQFEYGEGFSKLGDIQLVHVEKGLMIINMIAQHNIIPYEPIPIRYDALRECLTKITNLSFEYPNSTIHMPRIGCGLAQGKWSKIEPIITEVLCDVNVLVYDL